MGWHTQPDRPIGSYDPADKVGQLFLVVLSRQPTDAESRRLAAYVESGGPAKDPKAAGWYMRFGALPLLDDPLKLVFPLDVIAVAIAASGKHRG